MEEQKPRILVVDDEPKLVRLVREVLSASGYSVLSANNGDQAIRLIAEEQPDLVLLDIVLADEVDGYEVTQRVREFSNVPIIMLTAKVRESDLLRGYAVGTDDYITKPFSAKELLVRVQAVLKRSQSPSEESLPAVIQCGDLTVDLARRRVNRAGEEIQLTRTEYNLFQELIKHRNQVMTHEKLLTEVWGAAYRDDIDYLRAYIRYLRKKIEVDPTQPQLIKTYQGVGYMIECPDSE